MMQLLLFLSCKLLRIPLQGSISSLRENRSNRHNKDTDADNSVDPDTELDYTTCCFFL